MQLSYAFLADYAQVENGKVYVFGGGVTVLWRSEYPAPMGVSIVLDFAYNHMEAGSERTLALQINDADGQPVAPPLDGNFVLPPRLPETPVSLPLSAPLAISIAGNVPMLPKPGLYVVEVSIDGNHVRSLQFAAAEPPQA